jgi:hypothetical protein
MGAMARTILLLAAAAAAALVAALPAGAATNRRCGTIPGQPVSGSRALILGDVRATGTICATARSIARSWRASSRCGGSRSPITSCTIRGWTCRQVGASGEVSDWRCRRAVATVRFSPGA